MDAGYLYGNQCIESVIMLMLKCRQGDELLDSMSQDIAMGEVRTIACEQIATVHDWLGRIIEHSPRTHILISRLPPRRLLERIDLTRIETHWLTENQGDGALFPHLERMDSTIRQRVAEGQGLIIQEGIELLIGMHGWDAVMTYVRSIVDAISNTGWSLVLPLDPLTMEPQQIAMLRREAPAYTIPEVVVEEEAPILEVEEKQVTQEIEPSNSFELTEDGTPRLIHLVRIPRSGFNLAILRKRIMSWRRMGLDVSEVEPALSYDDEERAYRLYAVVEEKVRIAVELDRVIDLIAEAGDSKNSLKYRFKIRQLSGLEDVMRSLDLLVSES